MAEPIDYDSRQAAILSALRKAEQLQQAQTPATQYRQFGDVTHVLTPGPLSNLASALNRGAGAFEEKRAASQQSELDANQMREFENYRRELSGVPSETKRVLKQALAGQAPTYEDVALTPEEQNARRMDIAMGMSRLPKARGMATELFKQGIDFPEKQAALQEKFAAQKEMLADKLEAQAANEKLRMEDRQAAREAAAAARAEAQATRMMIAQMSAGIAKQNADINRDRLDETKRQNQVKEEAAAEKVQLKAEGDAAKEQEAAGLTEGVIASIDQAIGKRDASGKLLEGQKYHPGFRDYVGAAFGPLKEALPIGTDASDFAALHGQFTGSARLEAMDKLRGTGSVSNAEGAAAAQAITALRQNMTPESYEAALLKYRALLQKGLDRRARGIKITPEGKEYKPGSADDPAVRNMKLGPATITTPGAGTGGVTDTTAGTNAPTVVKTQRNARTGEVRQVMSDGTYRTVSGGG